MLGQGLYNSISDAVIKQIKIRVRAYDIALKDAKTKIPQSDLFNGRTRRFYDDPRNEERDRSHSQRQQLLRMGEAQARTSESIKNTAKKLDDIGAIAHDTVTTLRGQRETIEHTSQILYESEGNVDRSSRTIRTMARQ